MTTPDTKDESMHMVAPTFKFEWNLNTIAQLVTFGLLVFGGGVAWANIDAKFGNVSTWISGHESYHKDRIIQTQTEAARTDERLRTAEGKYPAIDQLTYRMTVNEQTTVSINQTLQDLKNQVNDQSANLRVIQEILTRMERVQTQNTPAARISPSASLH